VATPSAALYDASRLSANNLKAPKKNAEHGMAEAKRTKLGLALWGTVPVPELVRQVQIAEAIGLESVWVIDSQLICRELFVTLTACLGSTSRIKLATGVTQPVTRHVSTTASAIATLNEMYPGRILSGVGTGFSSLRTIGMPSAKATELETFVRSLRSLLRQQEVAFKGGVSSALSWLETPCLTEVLVAASGPRMTRLGAAVGDGLILLQGVAPHLLERGIGWMSEGAKQAGRDPLDLSVTCWTPLGVGMSSQQGRDDVRARVASSLMQANPEWYEGEEKAKLESLREAYNSFEHAASRPDHAAYISDEMVKQYAVAGDFIEISEQLSALMLHPRIDRVVLTAHGGDSSLDEVFRVLDKNVLPKVNMGF
jgi:5,10-methylenetetrahydromethanopterin reductase